MSPSIATILCTGAILVLFLLDRDKRVRTSWALWLPMSWIFLSSSRPVSEWLNGISTPTEAGQYLQGNSVDAATYALLLGSALAVLMARRSSVTKILQHNRPIMLFVMFCALSIIWSDFPVVALKRWIKSLGDYSMILVMLTERDCEVAVRRVLARVSFVVIPVSILFIKYYPQLGRTYAAHWDATQFFVGICDNKNMLGMVCLVLGVTAWCRILEAWQGAKQQRRKKLIVHGGIFLATMWLLLISDSKTSLSCFVLAAMVVTAHAFVPAARKRPVLNLLVISVVLASSVVLFLGVGGGALKAIGRNSTLTGRTEIWSILLTVPINPLLGTGFESFWLGPRLVQLWRHQILNGITEAHDGYLEMYLNLGWAGIAMLILLLWTGYRNIQRLLDRYPTAGRLRLGFFIAAVVYDFTEAGFRTADLVWIAFLIAIFVPPQTASKALLKKRSVPREVPVESIFQVS